MSRCDKGPRRLPPATLPRAPGRRWVLRNTLYGYAAREIIEDAKAHDVGVIIMGSRGRGERAGLVLGSTAHKVIHLADRRYSWSDDAAHGPRRNSRREMAPTPAEADLRPASRTGVRQSRASHASAGRWPGILADRRAVKVEDPGARGGQAPLRYPVMMSAQQQLGWVRPACGRGHDRDDRWPGGTAAGASCQPCGAPVDDGSIGLLRPGLHGRRLRRAGVPPGHARMQGIHGHALMIACSRRAEQGRKSPAGWDLRARLSPPSGSGAASRRVSRGAYTAGPGARDIAALAGGSRRAPGGPGRRAARPARCHRVACRS